MIAPTTAGALAYGELVGDRLLHVAPQPTSQLRDPASSSVIGQPLPRVDIPAKVTGGAAYVQDLRLARHGAWRASCGRRATARS